jgi:hypothetical protein
MFLPEINSEKCVLKGFSIKDLMFYVSFLQPFLKDFYVHILYSSLFYLPPLRFQCVGGC